MFSNRNMDLSYRVKTLRMVFRKGPLFYIEYQLRIFFIILFSDSDLLSAVDVDTIGAIALLARIKQKPFVFDAHEWFEEVPELENQEMKKRIWQLIARWAIKKASLAYTIGSALAEKLTKVYRYPFKVIRNVPNWPPSTEKDQPPSSENLQIIYLGHVNKGRGLPEVIRAIHNLSYCTLTIVGAGDEYVQIRRLVSELNLESRVMFKGYVRPDNLPDIMRNYHLGINLLDSVSLSYKYSLANKFFDYVQMGIPVLTNQLPEYQRLNHEFEVAHLIPSLEEEDIKVALSSLYHNHKRLIQLRKNCHEASFVWHWSKEKEKLLTWYAELFARVYNLPAR